MKTLCSVALFGVGTALAGPGDFDVSFGQSGIAFLPSGLIADRANVAHFVTTDADGRVLAIGEASRPTDGPEGAVRIFARFLPGGLPDVSLAGTGYIHTTPDTLLKSVGLRAFPVAGGRTLLVEQRQRLCWPPRPACALEFTTPYFFVQRVNAGGQIDPTYGVMATVMIDTVQEDVVASSDGSLTVVGYRYPPISTGVWGGPLFSVQGVDSAGQLFLPWFSSRAAWDCGSSASATATSAKMARQADGRFLIAQQVMGPTGANSVCVSRLNPDATLDANYGDRGRLRISDARFAAAPARILALAERRGGGAALILEAPGSGTGRPVYLIWLTAGGALDPTHGGEGVIGPLAMPIDEVSAVALQPDDKVLLAGPSFTKGLGTPKHPLGPPKYQQIVRLNPSGAPDSRFGPTGEGFAPLESLGRRIWPRYIHVGDSNVIYVAGGDGDVDYSPPSPHGRFAVAKLKGDPRPHASRNTWFAGCGYTRNAPFDPTLPALVLLAAALLLARLRKRSGRASSKPSSSTSSATCSAGISRSSARQC